MRNKNGFTLIELVVVIVILGILAVMAAPKFIDIQDKAKISALKGLMGAMKSALDMTYIQALLEGKQKRDDLILVNGEIVFLYNGYPVPVDKYLQPIVTGLDSWKVNPENAGYTKVQTQIGYGYDGFACVLVYTAASDLYPEDIPIAAKVELKGDDCQ